MSQSLPIEKLINSRFDDLYLDLKKAQHNLLDKEQPELSQVEIEQSKTARSLLRVEKQAIQEKDFNTKSEESFLSAISGKINTEAEKQLVKSFQNIDNLHHKISGFDASIPQLLDMVGMKAATISTIEPLASDIPWLLNDLLKMVNQPKYKRLNNEGEAIIVSTMRSGLSFLGVENLIIILSCLAFKRALPQITDPYPQIKIRIWEEALATALSCKKIASLVGVNPNHAFCLGMLQQLGKIAITKLYFRIFDTVQRAAIQDTENTQKQQEHSALLKIKPSGNFLNQLIASYGLDISAQLINKMSMKRVFIANAMQEIADNIAPSDMSPLALVVKQGNAYAKYRILTRHKLIDVQQSKEFIRTLKIPKEHLKMLKAIELHTLNIAVVDTK